jgi:nitrogen regulatory protein PII
LFGGVVFAAPFVTSRVREDAMKRIEVTMPPAAYFPVRSVLQSLGIHAMSVSRVEVVDRRHGGARPDPGADKYPDARSAVKLELVVADHVAEHVRDAIVGCNQVHGRGAGRMLIFPINEVVELGSQGPAASHTKLPSRS